MIEYAIDNKRNVLKKQPNELHTFQAIPLDLGSRVYVVWFNMDKDPSRR